MVLGVRYGVLTTNTNVVVVAGDQPDPDPSDNTSMAETVTEFPDITTTISNSTLIIKFTNTVVGVQVDCKVRLDDNNPWLEDVGMKSTNSECITVSVPINPGDTNRTYRLQYKPPPTPEERRHSLSAASTMILGVQSPLKYQSTPLSSPMKSPRMNSPFTSSDIPW